MIELALRDEQIAPYIERLPGPVVRLHMSATDDLSSALNACSQDLMAAVNWAIGSVYSDDEAPGRVFMRNTEGPEMGTVTLVDPCMTYGSQTLVRP